MEAWDTWFRWREHGRLRDISIEDTWRRVSVALISVEPPRTSARWQARCMDALASWRLLPDERLLEAAGTGHLLPRIATFHASLNVAAFISTDSHTAGSIDLTALSDCAALAVRILDDATLLAAASAPRIRIGILGIADALALLGLAYHSDTGRECATAIARALADGCLRGSVALAAERGARGRGAAAALSRAAARAAPQELLRDAACHGLRHAALTAITPHPRLALLANDVTDALDPLREVDHVHVITTPDGQHVLRAPGYAKAALRASGHGALPDTLADMPWTAQILMRSAVQPWVDAPIDCPLLATHDLGDSQRVEASKLAATCGLREPVWQSPVIRRAL